MTLPAEQQFYIACIESSLKSTHTYLEDKSDDKLIAHFKTLRKALKFVVKYARDSITHERVFAKQWAYAKEFRHRGIDFKPYLKVDDEHTTIN